MDRLLLTKLVGYSYCQLIFLADSCLQLYTYIVSYYISSCSAHVVYINVNWQNKTTYSETNINNALNNGMTNTVIHNKLLWLKPPT